MATPKDKERIKAFRAWHKWATLFGVSIDISQRSIERMLAGRKPPPPRLLEALAESCTNRTLAVELRQAAKAPDEDRPKIRGHELTGVWIDELGEIQDA